VSHPPGTLPSPMDRKTQKRLQKGLRRAGWRLERYSKGMKCFSPNGEDLVVMHETLSDHRGGKNLMSEFRRAGFKFDG